MKKTIAFLLLVFPLFCIAQITFQQGYFIENGVKKECLIKNLAWKNNPTSIEYKLSEGEETKIKTIKEISEFSVNNAYKYKRFTVNIDRSETLLDRLNDKREPIWSKETLLLKVLVEGKITLYQYEENNFVRYFFSEGDNSNAEQLVYKEYKVDTYISKNYAFRQQLYNLMKDVNPDIEKYEKIKYEKKNLVNLFSDYNGSNGQQTTNLSEKQNKALINVRLTPGVTFTSVSINNDLSNVEYDFSNKIGFRIGAELEYIMPFNNNKWALFIDPNFQSYSDSGTKNGITGDIDYKFIQIPFGARYYMYLTPKSKVFVDAAYTMSLVMGGSYVTYKRYNQSDAIKLDVSNHSAFSIGAGYGYDRYSAAVRFNANKGILNTYPYWSSQYNSISIILGYRLF